MNHAKIHMQGTEGETILKGEMVKPRAPILVWSLFAFGRWPLVGTQTREIVKAHGSQCDALT